MTQNTATEMTQDTAAEITRAINAALSSPMPMTEWRRILVKISPVLVAKYYVWRNAYWGEDCGRTVISESPSNYAVRVFPLEENPGDSRPEIHLRYQDDQLRQTNTVYLWKARNENHKADHQKVWSRCVV